jgi:hypothetical protein
MKRHLGSGSNPHRRPSRGLHAVDGPDLFGAAHVQPLKLLRSRLPREELELDLGLIANDARDVGGQGK